MPTHLLLRGSTLEGIRSGKDSPADALSAVRVRGASTVEVSDFLLTSEWIESIKAARLSLVIQAYPVSLDDVNDVVDLARATKARAVNLHLQLPDTSLASIIKFVTQLTGEFARQQIPIVFQTCKDCITSDLTKTVQLVEAVPEMRLNMDVSQYARDAGQAGPVKELAPQLDRLMDHVDMIHGAIAGGLDLLSTDNGPESEKAALYQSFWAEAMRCWRRRNPAGTSLIFTPDASPQGNRAEAQPGGADAARTQENEAIWQMAQRAWKQSARAGKERCWG